MFKSYSFWRFVSRVQVRITDWVTCGAFSAWRRLYFERDAEALKWMRENAILKEECEEWRRQALYHNREHGLRVLEIRALEARIASHIS